MGKRTPIVHIEWRSRDAERLQQFYTNAFRWKFDSEMPGYAMADSGNKALGVGVMQIEGGSSLSPGVVAFLDSDDLGTTEKAVREAGGHVVVSAQAVPGWGRFTLFTDPDGNQLGLWQSEGAARKSEKKHDKRVKKEAKRVDRDRRDADEARVKEEKKAKRAEKKAEKKAEKRAAKARRHAEHVDGQAQTKKKAKKKKKKDKPEGGETHA